MKRLETAERLWRKVKRSSNGCWIWTGPIDGRGYGHAMDAARRSTVAHRAIYELVVGPIPEGLQLDHLCHGRDPSCVGGFDCLHRRCVNPSHLEPVTGKENLARSPYFGRTHCKRGLHEYTPANILMVNGRRRCRACNVAWGKAYSAKKPTSPVGGEVRSSFGADGDR